MDAIKVNDEQLLRSFSGWARGVLVANVEAWSQFAKVSALEKPVPPNLRNCQKASRVRCRERTSM
jgi:hypothetical protein